MKLAEHQGQGIRKMNIIHDLVELNSTHFNTTCSNLQDVDARGQRPALA
jgi:hypothetical protein